MTIYSNTLRIRNQVVLATETPPALQPLLNTWFDDNLELLIEAGLAAEL